MFPKNRRRAAKQSVDAAIHAALNDVSSCGDTSNALQLLLEYVHARSCLLSTVSEPLKRHDGQMLLTAMVEIARRQQDWVHPIHEWAAPKSELLPAISLAREPFVCQVSSAELHGRSVAP